MEDWKVGDKRFYFLISQLKSIKWLYHATTTCSTDRWRIANISKFIHEPTKQGTGTAKQVMFLNLIYENNRTSSTASPPFSDG